MVFEFGDKYYYNRLIARALATKIGGCEFQLTMVIDILS